MRFFVFVCPNNKYQLCIVKEIIIIHSVMTNKINLIVLFFLFLVKGMQAQGFEKIFGGAAEDFGTSVVPTTDGGFGICGSTESFGAQGFQMYLNRTDADGTSLWAKTYGGPFSDQANDIIQTDDNGFLIVGVSDISNIPADNQAYIVKVDAFGKEQWSKLIGGANDDRLYSVIATKDGNYLVTGATQIAGKNYDAWVIKLSKSGNVLWEKKYGKTQEDFARNVVETSNGYAFVGHATNTTTLNKEIYLFKTDTNGNLLWENTFGGLENDYGYRIALGHDGGLILCGTINANSDAYIVKTDANGAKQWAINYGGQYEDEGFGVVATQDGNYAITGSTLVSTSNQEAFILKIDPTGKTLWENKYSGQEGAQSFSSIANTLDKGLIACGSSSKSSILGFSNDIYIVKTNANGKSVGDFIQGLVYYDLNANCKKEANEPILNDWLIRAENKKSYFASSNAFGNYSMSVDTGSYKVNVLLPNKYWKVCQPTYDVSFKKERDTVFLDFAVRSAIDCPNLEVAVSTPQLQRCQFNTYTISYCNKGTTTAKNASIEVDFDDYLEVKNSQVPWISNVNNVYTFNIGNVAPGTCAKFDVLTYLDCATTVLGQTHCVKAHIRPDSICTPPNNLWDGSNIVVDGVCKGDTVIFQVKNLSKSPMQDTKQYIVIEDDVITKQATFKLPSFATATVKIPTKGSTYRIVAEQSSGHPGKSYPTIAIEACKGSNGTFTTGYATQFQEDDGDPFLDSDCQESVGPSNKNDKRGYPKGYKNERYISDTTDVAYLINFSNTLKDTVKYLSIVDSLSSFLDVTTINSVQSSHNFDWSVVGNGVLKFTFANIQLPDSSAGAAASQGFVKFRVSQKPKLPNGTVINNRATIAFNYGKTMLTNTTKHTVGKNFVTVNTKNLSDTQAQVQVYPNPFSEFVYFNVVGYKKLSSALTFVLYDPSGREVQRSAIEGNEYELRRNTLSTGIYMFQIIDGQKSIATGKVVVVD